MINSIEVFTAETGTGASEEVSRKELRILHVSRPVMAKIALSYGTTCTVQLQGKQIMKTSWETLSEGTFTTGTPKHLHNPYGEKRFEKYRLNITVNTGCTLTASIGVGCVEN